MSRLEDVSLPFRKINIARNDYDNNDQYNVGHADALSTGDENGKGEVNGQVGSVTDIKQKEKLVAKNKFNRNREYNDATA
jgi:hypothetical protein